MRATSVFRAARFIAVCVVYFSAAKVGLSLAFAAEQVTLVWPPAGLALATTVLLGPRIWPAVAIGAFAANATANEPLGTAAGIALGNTLEAVSGAWLLRRAGFQPALERVRDVLTLLAFGALLSPVVAATIGVVSLGLGEVEPWARFGVLWWIWWLGDAMGTLIVAAPVFAWTTWHRSRWGPKRLGESFALAAALAWASWFVFGRPRPAVPDPTVEYVLFPVIIWAAIRFGQRTTTLVVLTVSVVALLGTLQGFGPFVTSDPNQSLLLLQMFLAVAWITGLTVAAAESERRAAEGRIRENNDVLSAVTGGTTDAVFVKDLEGRYLMINPAGARLLGRAVDEVLGKDDFEFFSPDTAREIKRRDEWVKASGATQTFEEIGTVEGVTRTYLSTKGPYRDEHGGVAGTVGIARDITERKRVEEERASLLEQEKKLRADADEANRQKDEFLGMLAHELRNPLSAIRNAVEVVQRQKDPETLDWIFGVIDRQTRHLTRLVEDLLDVSRMTRGRIELRREPTELSRILHHAVETSMPYVRSREHELEISMPDETLPLLADVTRLEQVFVNLLNNAAKFTEPKGRISLFVERRDGFAVVSVRDSGIGIPSSLLPHVFDLFRQSDQSLARSQGGLGVGLTVVRTLVELHGGDVEARSAGPGRGSELVVRLPLGIVEHEPAERPATVEPPPSPRRVLVVEDNLDSAQSLARILTLQGHEVRVVHDGGAALEEVSSFDPAVVLLDIGLPGMDGFEVAERLRSAGSDVRLVALTGYGRQADRVRSREAGFDELLVKPVETERLERLFASLTRGGARAFSRRSDTGSSSPRGR